MNNSNVYNGRVAGISFEPAKTNFTKVLKMFSEMKDWEIKPQIRLVPDPKNPYDPFAVEVHLGQDDKFFMVGHVPKTHSKIICQLGIEAVVPELDSFNEYEGTLVGLTIIVNKR